MQQKRRVLSWLLVLVMMLSNVATVFAEVKPLVISVVSYTGLENGKDAEMSFKVTNSSGAEQKAYLITALYDETSNEMVHYNYVVETIAAKGEKLWGACLPIPEQGKYKVKVFAWEDMQSLKLVSNVVTVGEGVESSTSYEKILEETSTYLAKQIPQAMNSIGGEWSVLGLARSEHAVESSYYESYYEQLVQVVQQEVDKARPFGYKVTEAQRMAMAVVAMGKDASDVGGIDLIDYTWNKAKHFPGLSAPQNELGGRQGLNELVFGLITVDLQKSNQPLDAAITREQIIHKILTEYQVSGGGFALSAGSSSVDIDMTAMALQALAPYYKTDAKVKTAVDDALALLSRMQSETGGFGNSEATAQVVVALTALDIDPAKDARFNKQGNNPITDLLSYYKGDGQFSHTADGDQNMMATEQAHYALVAYDRWVKGKTALYDMTDVMVEKPIGEVSLSIEKRTIGKGDTLGTVEVNLFEGDTAWDVIKRQTDAVDIEVDAQAYTGDIYIASIDGDGEFDYGNGSGWKYSVNDVFPDYGVSAYSLKDGDQIRLRYCVTVASGELEEPLVQLLKEYIEAAKEYKSISYTDESFKVLQTAIEKAQVIAKDETYNTTDTEVELQVSQHIGALIDAIKQLQKADEIPTAPSEIPDDFANNIGLNKDFLEMVVGDGYQIIARRLPEIIDNPVSNTITHPQYRYKVVSGNSVTVDHNGYVSAVKEGVSIIAVTYDEVTANGRTYGAISPVNTGLFVVNVTDGTDTGIEISINSHQQGVVSQTRSYDTYYFTGDSIAYSFSVDANQGEVESVKVNGEVIQPQGDSYTVNLVNSGNIIEVTASNDKGTEVFAQVVDARKIEIIVENLTDPTRNDAIEVGDEVKVSFRGITLPVYKLATIYNPSWSSQWDPKGGTKVIYSCDTLGGAIKGKETQYDLATNNAIRFQAEQEGTYAFSGGYIEQGWWGSPLGTEKEMDGPGSPNLGATHYDDVFSVLPNFEVTVNSANYRPATGVVIDKEIPEIEVGESYQLKAEVVPSNATNQKLLWQTSNEEIATIDGNGQLSAKQPGEVMISVELDGTEWTDQVTVVVIPEQPATSEEREGLRQVIDEAKALDAKIYTSDTWNQLQQVLEESERVYTSEASLLAEIQEAQRNLKQVINNLERDFAYGLQITPNEITTGSQITIYLPNLVEPYYAAYPVGKQMYTMYQSDIEGLEEIKTINAYVNGEVDEEILKTITFTIPDTTKPGSYTLSGGMIKATSRHPQFGSTYNATFYEGRMPDIQIIVGESEAVQVYIVD